MHGRDHNSGSGAQRPRAISLLETAALLWAAALIAGCNGHSSTPAVIDSMVGMAARSA